MKSLVGKILSNRYKIDTFLGRGGMAEVYKVWDSRRMTFLAMKVLYEDLAIDRVFMRRFKREAETLEKLQHPNIVRFYGLEQDGPNAFMLLDYVEGKTLKRAIFDAGTPLRSKQLRFIMRSVCGALQFAHSEGLAHCDIKPANIMLHQNGTVLLADFGIARMTDAATATMVGAGTPAYMAPEQVRGEDPTPQTDIYALGIVLYEMLTGGERPFTGERAETTGSTSEKLRWEQMNMPPTNPREWNPDLSPELEEVVLKCLKKNPKERYKTALDLFNALELATGSVNADVEKAARPQPELDTLVEASVLPEAVSPIPKSSRRTPLSKFDRSQNHIRFQKNKWLGGGIGIVLLLSVFYLMGRSSMSPVVPDLVTATPTQMKTPIIVVTTTGHPIKETPILLDMENNIKLEKLKQMSNGGVGISVIYSYNGEYGDNINLLADVQEIVCTNIDIAKSVISPQKESIKTMATAGCLTSLEDGEMYTVTVWMSASGQGTFFEKTFTYQYNQ